METKIETIKITHHSKATLWDVVEDTEHYEGRRAYLQGTTKYYELTTFEAGLAKADSYERTPA